MDISCSQSCIYEKNGKCQFNQVTPLLNLSYTQNACAYFEPKKNKAKINTLT